MSLEVIDDSRGSLVLAIVAHPDDLEHGATSAVARWTSRGVSYVLATPRRVGLAIPPARGGGPIAGGGAASERGGRRRRQRHLLDTERRHRVTYVR